MNTTDNNSSPLSLQELQQRKHTLERKRNKWTGILLASLIVPFALEYILGHFLAEDALTRLIGISYLLLLLFMGYFVVKVTKWTWAINDVAREIKKVEEHQSAIAPETQPASSSTSTHHPAWSEKVAKALGAFTIIIAVCLVAIFYIIETFDYFTIEIPRLIEENFVIISLGIIWIGQGLFRYRSDMGLISRIAIWSSAALLSVFSIMCFMGCEIARWMMVLVFVLGVINLILIEKEAKSLKQDDMNS